MTNGFPIAEQVVDIPGGQVTVRGISLPDLTWLSQAYGPALREMFTRFRDSAEAGHDIGEFTEVAQEILTAVPELAAAIVAAGCGLREHVDSAARLSFPTQLALLVRIGDLTFAQEGGAKKVVETVFRMAGAVNQITADLNT